MLNFEKLKRRAVLTETLPYEVPTVFSNEFMFASELVVNTLPDELRRLLTDSDYRRPLRIDAYTIPFNFTARKGSNSQNTLSIVHPLKQCDFADFVYEYSATLLEQCNKSPASLRAPAEVVPFLSEREAELLSKSQDDFISQAPQDGMSGVDYAASFFSLRKYTLLDGFYKSNEIMRLETKFPYLRTIDVSKCFFNIYSHSVTWAVKEKAFSKSHSSKYSFEGRFDQIMQKANYNETNGIPVGPEFSRVFAEVIFQRIDLNIIEKMKPLVFGKDFTIRRYVDDFFLFALNPETIDSLTKCVEACLEEYKLYPNTRKQSDFFRPFVTNITRAKKGVENSCGALIEISARSLTRNRDTLDDSREADVARKTIKETSKAYRATLEEIRHVIAETKSTFSEVSSPIYSKIIESLLILSKMTPSEAQGYSEDISTRLRGLLRILFYSLASDFRVAPIFRCQKAVGLARQVAGRIGEEGSQVLDALIIFELSELFTNYASNEEAGCVPIEVCNIVVLASLVDANLFAKQPPVQEFLRSAAQKTEFSYFSFLCILFLVGKAEGDFSAIKGHIAKSVRKRLLAEKNELRRSSEVYLLFSDFVSCPHLDEALRAQVINEMLGVAVAPVEVATIAPHFAFVDWTGNKAPYILHRKRLQPVYSF
ncbi:MAG: RNA-directed DNA polymerase [Maritimibacter sp.]|uniref:antiviral reverse transcriptase Drt3b n=1 Tax=Maritimibacter sp. TaxID=2003363 RepID=UPI001E001F4A|nr:antiviral reverse transcriptase Drt3b [Maritimibacter sp.]MBL6426698.1 RNA-directed DNA polymerase [Maritimibacter sp.]